MPQFSFRDRRKFLERLREQQFDVVIIGGGVNGAGILRDLCLRSEPGRQSRLALIEKNHFATSASSKNSHLLHGGLRYLKYLDFGLVREALHERSTLLRIAPHGAWKVPFLLPVYERGKRWYYQAGTTLYDWLSGAERLGVTSWLNQTQALEVEPDLEPEGLRGAVRFWDGQMHASRLILDQLRESVESGAVALNFVEARETVRASGETTAIRARDRLTGEECLIRSRLVVYTVGPWEKTAPLKLVRGSHLVSPRLTRGPHALAFFEENGRILFVLPYGPGRRYSLVGTTEKVQHTPEPVLMSADEEAYLLRQVDRILPRATRAAGFKPSGHFTALRPLLAARSKSLSAISRRHQIWKSTPNIYHLGGGKWTIFRRMAQELVDLLVADHHLDLGPCRTSTTPIDGNTVESLRALAEEIAEMNRHHGMPDGLPGATVSSLHEHYGRRAMELIEMCRDPQWRRPLVPGAARELPYIYAQMQWAVENEMTGRLDDFLTISTPLAYLRSFTPEEMERLEKEFERLL